jgi:uncharacterized protein
LTGDQIRAHDHQSNAVAQPLGRILSVNGSQAGIGLLAPVPNLDDVRATVGKFVGIRCGQSCLVGVITDVSIQKLAIAREQGYAASAQVDMMGEIKTSATGLRFQRGVTDYPAIGDPADLLTRSELQVVYDLSDANTINIGHLQHDNSVGALIKIDEMLSKHFAILGTTGVGKSSGVVLILRAILERRPDLRIFLVDPHNEYGQCFGERAQVLNPRNLKLPFWLFNFEETVDVIFGGRPGVDEEVEILSEVIPLAKSAYTQYRSGAVDRLTIKKYDSKNAGFTADTPVPYRLADLINLIDERMGKLENRSSRMKYHRLIQRIETVRNDPRYAFMFDNANVGGDTMAEVLAQVFRLPTNGVPMTIMQLGGFPAEVVDSVVSVLCRMAFDFGLWSDGAIPLLFVCEEAHRYASADRTIGFGPTRRAISRIAKEGRKYGVYLGLVTQRPAELDPTIISQCSTLFVMRLANDRDQALLRSAVSDAAANLLAFVPSLGTREVIAFGEGMALPTRLKFKELPVDVLRKRDAEATARMDAGHRVNEDFVISVLERWRGATMSHNLRFDDNGPEVDPPMREDVAPLQPAAGLDPNRFTILKKPTEGRADVFATPRGAARPPLRTPPR